MRGSESDTKDVHADEVLRCNFVPFSLPSRLFIQVITTKMSNLLCMHSEQVISFVDVFKLSVRFEGYGEELFVFFFTL